MKKILLIAIAVSCDALGTAQAASMYKCVEAGGKVSYADHPCEGASREAWSSRLGSRSKTMKQIPAPEARDAAKPRPKELAGHATPDARNTEAARIDALRVEEMTRILGQQAN